MTIAVLASLMLLLLTGVASAATVFSTNFESGAPAQIGGFGGTHTSGTLPGLGSTIWRNDAAGNPAAATTLTLTGLTPNASLSMSFDFIAIDSWDGTTFSCCTPDHFNVNLNGQNILQATEYQCCGPQAANGNQPISLDALTFSNGASGTFGLTFFNGANHVANGTWADSVWHVTINGLSANALGTASFSFFASGAGWQGGADESFGLDNIVVASTAVPVPGSLVLMVAGVLSLGAAVRRRFGR